MLLKLMRTTPLIKPLQARHADSVLNRGAPLQLNVCWQVRDSRGIAADILPKNQQLSICVANQGQKVISYTQSKISVQDPITIVGNTGKIYT